MKRTVYISSLVCSLLFSACDVETLQPQAGDSYALQLGFAQEGNISLEGRGGGTLTAEDGTIDKIGVCITGSGHDAYPGTTGIRYTYTADDGKGYAGTDIPADGTPPVTIYLNGQDATLQAFHPATATVTSTGSGNRYTIPAAISGGQRFSGNSITGATDYLYGSGKNATGDATAITANGFTAAAASPTIYMHHALAKVVFTLQCDANRTPHATYDCVKSIKMTAASGTPFRYGTGTMQINNGTLAGLTTTDELTFTPASGADPMVIGANGTAATVACGLVAPLSANPGNITLTVTLGEKNSADRDRTYTATNTAFNVQWQKGYCYTYNLVLGNKLATSSEAISWKQMTAADATAKERGISTASELKNFREAWNRDGLQKKAKSGEYDYTSYEPYGWYDQNNGGRFTIKLTSDITFNEAESWTPIGTEDKPLIIPFDGQGWKVILQLQTKAMAIAEKKYSGFIGYAVTDIKNLSIVTDPQFSVVSTGDNKIISTGATYAGGLAGYVEGDITNCSVDLKGTDITNSAPAGAACYVGGLVGGCKGNIYNSAVYATSADSNTASITITDATDGSCLGGLAGKVEGTSGTSGNVANCYTHLEGLGYTSDSGTSTVSAGWLVGDKIGAAFDNAYYMAGTSSVTTDDNKAGISSFADWGTLCTSLNQTATAKQWAQWREQPNTTSGSTEKVTLILR